jgi:hypothetical protein
MNFYGEVADFDHVKSCWVTMVTSEKAWNTCYCVTAAGGYCSNYGVSAGKIHNIYS